mgnify:CR=1 FL=1
MTFQLVQNDTAPQVQATITKSHDGSVVDLTDATIRLKFREKGATTTLFTLTGFNVPDTNFANGIVLFLFGAGDLDIYEGYYEGEVEITYDNTTVDTVYEVLNFRLRADF